MIENENILDKDQKSDERRNEINKIDMVDKSEMPSKSKLRRMISGDNGVEDLPIKKSGKKVGFIGLTAKYFLKKWPLGLTILFFVIIAAAATAFGPWMIKGMTEAITNYNTDISKIGEVPLAGQNIGGIFDLSWQEYMYIQIGLFVVIAVGTLVANMLAGFLGKWIEIDLRNKTIERLITQDMSYYSDKKIGDVLTKVISDTQIIGDQSQAIPVTFLSALFTTIFSVAMMFVIDWKLAIVALVLFAIILLLILCTFGGLRKLMFKVRDSITKINGTVINRINTVQLIKTSGTEEYETKLFEDIHKDYAKKDKSMIIMQSFIIMFLIVGISSIQVCLTIAAAIIYKNNWLTMVEVLPAMILAVGIMVGPIMQVVRVVAGMVIASTAAERIAEILNSESKINPHIWENEGIYIDQIKGDIIFKDVTFAYPEKPNKVILPNFDFKFEQGKSYAFVGETGAGKSTISKLLLRYYDPTFGEVLINNDINIKDLHLPTYLNHVGYVEQEPQILLGNVIDNVKYGTEGKTDEEVIEACKKVDLHNLVMSWPEGYDTVLGERGFMLSGGQKQRLVIARMFLKDPQLLILDEATSALDNIVEKEIQEQLDKLMIGRTTVSIAHRLSTIKNADQIIVLAPGKGIAQVGTFEELKTKEGHFKKLYDAGLMK